MTGCNISAIFLALAPLALCQSMGGDALRVPANAKTHETCFLAIPFYRGATLSITLENQGKQTHEIAIGRYSANGKLVASEALSIAGGEKREVRLDLASGEPDLGWVRVLESWKTGLNSVLVSADFEYLDGNTLASLPDRLAVYRSPLSEEEVRNALRHSLRHRYGLDRLELPESQILFFVNLSDYPVQVGMCEADYPGCRNAALPYTVGPLASVSFPISKAKRFLVLESTPGYSAATPVKDVEGLKRVFGSDSSITFGPTTP